MALPAGVRYVVIGAGVHGLSTAYHLALELKAKGRGEAPTSSSSDKTGDRRRRLRHRLRRHPQQLLSAGHARAHGPLRRGLGERSRGLQLPPGRLHADQPGVMHEDVATIAKQQKEIGYTSEFIEGEADCRALHEGPLRRLAGAGHHLGPAREEGRLRQQHQASMHGLAAKAEAEGVRILTGVKVTGLRARRELGAVTGGRDRPRARSDCEHVVVGVGPWIKSDLGDARPARDRDRIKGRDGKLHDDVPMWTYWCLQEGTLGVDPELQKTNDGRHAARDPRRHRRAALFRRRRLADHRQAVGHLLQAGLLLRRRPGRRHALPGRDRPGRGAGRSLRPGVARTSSSARTSRTCGARRSRILPEALRGQVSRMYKKEPSGGIGCFTPDSFPVFDVFRENCYVIADSNHGYKMIGVGKLVAGEILGETQPPARAVPLLALSPRASCTRSRTARFPGAEASAPASADRSETGRARDDRSRGLRRSAGPRRAGQARCAPRSTSSASPTSITSSSRSPGASSARGSPPTTGSASPSAASSSSTARPPTCSSTATATTSATAPRRRSWSASPTRRPSCSCRGTSGSAASSARCFRNREEDDDPGAFLTSDCRGNLRRDPRAVPGQARGLHLRHGTEPEMMWLKKDADGKPAGGFSKPYCYHIDQFEIAAAGRS